LFLCDLTKKNSLKKAIFPFSILDYKQWEIIKFQNILFPFPNFLKNPIVLWKKKNHIKTFQLFIFYQSLFNNFFFCFFFFIFYITSNTFYYYSNKKLTKKQKFFHFSIQKIYNILSTLYHINHFLLPFKPQTPTQPFAKHNSIRIYLIPFISFI
jgi:hypothetical protein